MTIMKNKNKCYGKCPEVIQAIKFSSGNRLVNSCGSGHFDLSVSGGKLFFLLKYNKIEMADKKITVRSVITAMLLLYLIFFLPEKRIRAA